MRPPRYKFVNKTPRGRFLSAVVPKWGTSAEGFVNPLVTQHATYTGSGDKVPLGWARDVGVGLGTETFAIDTNSLTTEGLKYGDARYGDLRGQQVFAKLYAPSGGECRVESDWFKFQANEMISMDFDFMVFQQGTDVNEARVSIALEVSTDGVTSDVNCVRQRRVGTSTTSDNAALSPELMVADALAYNSENYTDVYHTGRWYTMRNARLYGLGFDPGGTLNASHVASVNGIPHELYDTAAAAQKYPLMAMPSDITVAGDGPWTIIRPQTSGELYARVVATVDCASDSRATKGTVLLNNVNLKYGAI